jgi:predicted negative regulator of RcsB-dependent stress response
MDLDLEEQEQLANLKAFWQDYGRWLAVGVLIACIGYGIYWMFQRHSINQSLKASQQYEVILADLAKNNLPEVLSKTQKLQQDFPKTAYAGMAGLLTANLANSVNDKETASTQLQWVSEHSSSDNFATIAKLRLVTLLIDQNTPEAFSKADVLLQKKAAVGFEALQLERRGDWFWAQNQTEEARKSYLDSWKILSEIQLKASGQKELTPDALKFQQQNPANEQRLLKLKIESLGGF